jgi:phosphocarrier protein FPr
MTEVLHGLAAAPGIGIGAAVLYRPGLATRSAPRPERAAVDPAAEWQHFLDARTQVDAELAVLGENPNSVVAEIFAAHRLILQDNTLLHSVRRVIFDEQTDAVTATQRVVSDLADILRSLEDEYFAGRAADVVDLGQRLLSHLGAEVSRAVLTHLPPDTVLIADDLTPSDLTLLPQGHVIGVALAYSAPTAHSAILARSVGLPLVCGIGPRLMQRLPGGVAIVDGNHGDVFLDASPDDVARFTQVRQFLLDRNALARSHAHLPAITQDGVLVPVLANANSPGDVAVSRAVGADGIGLLRTEYLFRGRAVPPSFDEQRETYTRFIAQVNQQLTVRALDAGGDKPVEYIAHHREDNPFLGLRGIRLLIAEPKLLRTQYRALCAAAHASPYKIDVRFMLPMISTAEEIAAVRAILAEPDGDGDCPWPPLKLGIMIEVPSAALIAHALAPHVDFFSIGTNDLSQYVLASDRTNSSVAKLADPLHPAVLHLIKITCDAAAAHDKPVSLCGEVAGDPLAAPLLLGLGVTELSVPLPAVPPIKETVRGVTLAHCRTLAAAALACDSVAAVRACLTQD